MQAKGDKAAASSLLDKYSKVTPPLKLASEELEKVQVPADIIPTIPVADELA